MPHWSSTLCLLLVAGSFLAFGPSLGRYPPLCVDDAFFSYPAVRYLEGKGLTYQVSPQAPHGDSVWAYHGPFFPRLQVMTFRLLGVSEFACRIPQYLAAHLAIAVLGVVLLNRGYTWSAILLAIAWIGDRSLLEVLYGRMEGICLFLNACAFGALLKAVEGRSWAWACLSSCCLGLAAGFNPVTLSFGLVSLPILVLALPPESRLRVSGGGIAGAAIPAALLVLCWYPHLDWAIEQFTWHARLVKMRNTTPEKIADLIRYLRWAKWWFFAEVLVVVVLMIPLSVALVQRSRGNRTGLSRDSLPFIIATGFSVAGLMSVFGTSILPYYLVHFTVWPVLGIAVLWESNLGRGTRLRPIMNFAIALLLCAWLPSLAWNIMRFRECLLYEEELDRRPIAQRLAHLLPPGAKVSGEHLFFTIAREAGLHYGPLPVWAREIQVPPDHWILIIPELRKDLRMDSEAFRSRDVVARERAFPGSKYYEIKYVLFGPARPEEDPRSSGPRRRLAAID
ncbi:MAG: hypothetical protein IRY99_03865 [Isosphaeraceae bacterium]|nr:hypothetical protein [Isosphaeraceae bacterium]